MNHGIDQLVDHNGYTVILPDKRMEHAEVKV